MFYRQCSIEKITPRGILKKVSYLPEEFSILGQPIKLRDENKIWDNGWKVIEVSSTRVDEKHLPDSHKIIKAHRDKTGDTTPKVDVKV